MLTSPARSSYAIVGQHASRRRTRSTYGIKPAIDRDLMDNKYFLLLCLLAINCILFISFIQCEKNQEPHKREGNSPPYQWMEGKLDNSKPCICNGKYHAVCPTFDKCEENKRPKVKESDKREFTVGAEDLDDPEKPPHDDLHPDHVDIAPDFRDSSHRTSPRTHLGGPLLKWIGGRLTSWLGPTNSTTKIEPDRSTKIDTELVSKHGSKHARPLLRALTNAPHRSLPDDDPFEDSVEDTSHRYWRGKPSPHSDSDGNRILRHRKVYVSKKDNKIPVLDPISITIPLKVDDDTWSLPTPKRVYKFKKYTTFETKPEIQMVPVTKTIIKPANLTPDQIVDESGEIINKDLKAIKKP